MEVEDEKTSKKRGRDEDSLGGDVEVAAEQALDPVADEAVEPVNDGVLTETVTTPIVKRVKTNAGEPELENEQNGVNSDDTKMDELMENAKEGANAQEVKEAEEVEEKAGDDEAKAVTPIKLGPKLFHSGVEMFTYLYELLHAWNCNHNVNKYEFMVLSDLIKKSAPQKLGEGIESFQIRMHPSWQSRCYYLIRTDGSVDDFSYRKCVDKLMPLPPSLFKPSGDLDLDKLFPDQKGRHHHGRDNGGGGGQGDRGHRGGRGFHGGRGGGGRGGRGRGGRGKGGRWSR